MDRPTKEQYHSIYSYLKLLTYFHHESPLSLAKRLGHSNDFMRRVAREAPERLPKIVPYLTPSACHQVLSGNKKPFQSILDTLAQTAEKTHGREDLKRYATGLALAHGTSLYAMSKPLHQNLNATVENDGYTRIKATLEQVKEYLNGEPVKSLSELIPDHTLTSEQTELAQRYVNLLAFSRHDSLKAVSKRVGHRSSYVNTIILEHPYYLPNVIPYLSRKTFDRVISGDKKPFHDILNKMRKTVKRTRKLSDLKRYVMELVYAHGTSISKIAQATDYGDTYIQSSLNSHNRLVLEPLLERIAKGLGVNAKRLTELLDYVPLRNVPYYHRHDVIKKEQRLVKPGQSVHRQLLLNYVWVEKYLHHDDFKHMLRRFNTETLNLPWVIKHVNGATLPDRVSRFMPYLDKNTLRKVTYGDASPLNAILAKLSHDVKDRRSYYHFLCAVSYAHGFKLNKLNMSLGHIPGYIYTACKDDSLPTLTKRMRTCSRVLGVKPAVLVKPIEQIKDTHHFTGHLGRPTTSTDWNLYRLKNEIIDVFHVYSRHFHVTNQSLSEKIFNDKTTYWYLSGGALYHCYYAVKKMIAITSYEPKKAKRYCQAIKDFYKTKHRR